MATYLQVLAYKLIIRYGRLSDVTCFILGFGMGLAKNVFSKDMVLSFQLKYLVNSVQVSISKEKHFSHELVGVKDMQIYRLYKHDFGCEVCINIGYSNFFCNPLMKNVVECQKEFFAYFNALETYGVPPP